MPFALLLIISSNCILFVKAHVAFTIIDAITTPVTPKLFASNIVSGMKVIASVIVTMVMTFIFPIPNNIFEYPVLYISNMVYIAIVIDKFHSMFTLLLSHILYIVFDIRSIMKIMQPKSSINSLHLFIAFFIHVMSCLV